MQEKQIKQLQEIVSEAQHIVVIQADNPDADSLASALALEHILGDQGKQVTMFCAVDIPGYLRYLPGADRVTSELPSAFDAVILVDCSTVTLLEKLESSHLLTKIKQRPVVVIDHHDSEANLPFDHTLINEASAVATGEVIYRLAKKLDWPLSLEANELLVSSILADSLGLTTENVTADSIQVLADLVRQGVSIAKLEDRRRSSMSKPLSIIAYKGTLLQRIEYYADNQLAVVDIPWNETEQYSPLYNPAILALEELRFAEGVKLAVVLKTYPDGKITGKLRSNYGSKVAGDLAGHFGGGGHQAASGFKTFGWKLDELKKELIKQATQLLHDEASNSDVKEPKSSHEAI